MSEPFYKFAVRRNLEAVSRMRNLFEHTINLNLETGRKQGVAAYTKALEATDQFWASSREEHDWEQLEAAMRTLQRFSETPGAADL